MFTDNIELAVVGNDHLSVQFEIGPRKVYRTVLQFWLARQRIVCPIEQCTKGNI